MVNIGHQVIRNVLGISGERHDIRPKGSFAVLLVSAWLLSGCGQKTVGAQQGLGLAARDSLFSNSNPVNDAKAAIQKGNFGLIVYPYDIDETHFGVPAVRCASDNGMPPRVSGMFGAGTDDFSGPVARHFDYAGVYNRTVATDQRYPDRKICEVPR